MKLFAILGILFLFIGFTKAHTENPQLKSNSIEHADPVQAIRIKLFYDDLEEPIRFAAVDLERILSEKGYNVALKPLTAFLSNPGGISIVIAKNDP